MKDSDVSGFLTALSNPVRLTILNCLRTGRSSFTELMKVCGYDPRSQCGTLDYHLKRLRDEGLVGRKGGGYVLLEKGSHALEIMDQVKEKEFAGCEDMNEEDLVVREFHQEDVETFEKTFPKKVREEVKGDFLRQFLQSLVSGAESTIRADSLYSILRHWGLSVSMEEMAVLREERLSLIAVYKDKIVGFITFLTFNAKPDIVFEEERLTNMELKRKFEELKRKIESRELALAVVTAVWASPTFDKRKIVDVLITEAVKQLRDKSVLQIQFISIRKELADLLSECGFIMRDEIYLGLDPFKSKELCDELSGNLGFHTLPLAHSIVYMAQGGKMTTFAKYPETAILWLP